MAAAAAAAAVDCLERPYFKTRSGSRQSEFVVGGVSEKKNVAQILRHEPSYKIPAGRDVRRT
jgi:hypothetical protein